MLSTLEALRGTRPKVDVGSATTATRPDLRGTIRDGDPLKSETSIVDLLCIPQLAKQLILLELIRPIRQTDDMHCQTASKPLGPLQRPQ